MSVATAPSVRGYDPGAVELLAFHRAVPGFLAGDDTPRAFLERCIAEIERHEPEVKAFVTLNLDGARAAADAATRRYAEGRPLSPVDGMPFGVKDIFETEDMPTGKGSAFHEGERTGRDAAHVHALRKGGALILGKTVTTEFAMARPGPTRNPFDLTRTPGGSSSGTSAAIAARMIVAGSGTQAKGSVVRPASYCGNWAIKPTFGALHRGGGTDAFKSFDHVGIHAGSLRDMWTVAGHVARTVGGDPGHLGLTGPVDLPTPRRPLRLARLQTRGWGLTDAASRAAFDGFVDRLRAEGVTVLDTADDPRLEAYEAALLEVTEIWTALADYEMLWPMQTYRDRDAGLLGPSILAGLERGERMTPAEYRHALVRRDRLRLLHDSLAHEIDGYVTLSAPGPAPEGMPVGDPVYNEPSSLVGCPSLNVPLLAVGGLPLGVQLMGFAHGDAAQCAIAAWLSETVLGRTA